MPEARDVVGDVLLLECEVRRPLEVSDAKKLKALEEENARLKRLLAEAMLERAIEGAIGSSLWRALA